MKSIELTEEHKTKLLEMCKVLCPEYNWHIGFSIFYDQGGEGPYEEVDLGYLHLLGFHDGKGNFPNLNIHWFEFCMTHLAPKITNGKTYYIFCDRCNSHKHNKFEYSKEFIEKYLQHPVDYLYEQFKLLKHD